EDAERQGLRSLALRALHDRAGGRQGSVSKPRFSVQGLARRPHEHRGRGWLMSGVVHAQAERLVEILGVPLALKFAERFGGRGLSLPQPERLKAESALAALLGFPAAQKLAFEWRGLEVMVPKCRDWMLARRNAEIRARHDGGQSMRALAEAFGLTEKR